MTWAALLPVRCAAVLVVMALLCAGCATPADADGAAASQTPIASAGDKPRPQESLLASFEQRYRSDAQKAGEQSRWAEAIWAWDVVLALHPDDAQAATQRGRAQAAAQAVVADKAPKARAAQQRGELDTATRLWLEVLALAPDHAAAADALRQIERNRARRQNIVGGFRASGVRPVRNPEAETPEALASPPAKPAISRP
jgi:hypothetical protein